MTDQPVRSEGAAEAEAEVEPGSDPEHPTRKPRKDDTVRRMAVVKMREAAAETPAVVQRLSEAAGDVRVETRLLRLASKEARASRPNLQVVGIGKK